MSLIRRTGMVALALASVAAVPPQEGSQIREVAVRVGARSIRALCTDGPREALLLHGEGADADTWRPVLERLDGTVGACAYDRPGSGRSGPVPETRGWFELEDEMRRIHAALGYRPGYTLVGHSVGGLYARLFAAGRPSDVGALVLVDPAHEDMPEAVRPGMPDTALEAWERRRRSANLDGVREVELAERLRRSRLPDVPVTVITATRRPQGDGFDQRFLNEAARRVHASILRGITIGRHIPAARSGHDVQLDEPELVSAEIARLVAFTTGPRQ